MHHNGKEHIGYIVDRVGYKEYKNGLDGIDLPELAEVSENVNWDGIHYMRK